MGKNTNNKVHLILESAKLNFEEPVSMFYKMLNNKVAFNTRIYEFKKSIQN
jgi:hypothetical protein